MFKEHKSFNCPPDDTRIWRYMDLPRLASLIESGSLFFSSPAFLGDAWEGVLNERSVDAIPAREWGRMGLYEPGSWPFDDGDDYMVYLRSLPDIRRTISITKNEYARERELWVGVSCWHINEDESMGMWKAYSPDQKGIAIDSTIGALKKSIRKEQQHVHIGSVQYVDHANHLMNLDNVFDPLLYKRRPFSFEAEVRAIARFDETRERSYAAGWLVPVELGDLINRIVICPNAPENYDAIVRAVCATFAPEITIEVCRSSIEEAPPTIETL